MASIFAAIGFAYDAGSGNNALGGVFAAFYVLGCVAAIAAVRQSGIFTAVIQPPLILFVAVPFAYFVFHGSTFTGVKDTLINYGYPLIERFPLMFFTTATVLLIGMVRWFLASVAKRGVSRDNADDTGDTSDVIDPPDETAAPTATKPRRTARGVAARASRAASAAAAAVASPGEEAKRPPRKARPAPSGSQRSSGATTGTGSRRSRHSRAPETEIIEPVANRPRRRTPPTDPPVEPRRRPRPNEPREPREREPRDRRQPPPGDRRTAAERPDRYERPQRRERPDERSGRPERPQRRPRPADYDPYDPPPTRSTNGGGTHHPVSRVRYRGADDGESRVEQRTRPRRSRHAAPDSWEYDA